MQPLNSAIRRRPVQARSYLFDTTSVTAPEETGFRTPGHGRSKSEAARHNVRGFQYTTHRLSLLVRSRVNVRKFGEIFNRGKEVMLASPGARMPASQVHLNALPRSSD